jgi:hypothetical protein
MPTAAQNILNLFRNTPNTYWLPSLIYAVMAMAVLQGLLLPGYVLTLDMAQSPNMNYLPAFFGLDESLTGALPFQFLQQMSGGTPLSWLFQKAVLFLILFCSGLGAHRLMGSKGAGAYFAGTLYMINPFVYVRFMAGQWGVLWAYCFTPFAAKSFLEVLDKGGIKAVIKAVFLTTLAGLLQPQGFFLTIFAFLALLAIHLIKERKDKDKLRQTGKYLAVYAVLLFTVNLYWLIPGLTAQDTLVSRIGEPDLMFFAPHDTSGFGVVFDVASLWGFWRTGYLLISDFLPLWWLLFVIILYLVISGFISKLSERDSRWAGLSFGMIGAASLILATGAASEFSRPLFNWLWDRFPLFHGFRDSHKFLALLCLAYAYLGGTGVRNLTRIANQQRKKLPQIFLAALIVISFLTPPAYAWPIFGFQGQLAVTDYPEEWYEVNDYLNRDKGDFNVLFLPWHMYMDYSWLPNKDKRLTNPAPQFFNKPIIAGDNIEVQGIYSQSANPVSRYIEFLLSKSSGLNNLGELLAPLNVKYIILVKEADHESYDFLNHQEDLKVTFEASGITLFENIHSTARIYAVDAVEYIKNLDEYIELSKTQDVMKHLYVIGESADTGGHEQMEKPDFKEKTPVKYEVEGSALKYTAFTVPQRANTLYWEYNGSGPVFRNLGFMPAFMSSPDGGEIRYTRFYRVYLPCYGVSAMTLLVMIILLFLPGGNRHE